MFVEFLGLCVSLIAYFAPVVLAGGLLLFLLALLFGTRMPGDAYAAPRAGRVTAVAARAALAPVTGREASASAAKLREEGATPNAAAAYFISKSQSAPEGVAATVAVLGPLPALLRWIFAFVSSAVVGFFATPASDRKKRKKLDPAAYAAEKAAEKEELAARRAELRADRRTNRLSRAGMAAVALVRSLPGLLIACVIAAAVTTALPDTFFTDLNFSGRMVTLFLALVFSFLVGSPGLSAAPLVLGLMLRALDPGVGLFILCIAPTFNMTELYNLGRALGRAKAIIYMLANCVLAFLGAKIMQDLFMGKLWAYTAPQISAKPMENGFFLPGILIAAVLAVGAVFYFVRRNRANRIEIPEDAVKLYVSGRWNVDAETELSRSLSTVEGVEVLGMHASRGLVLIRGPVDFDALSDACAQAGFTLDKTEE